MPCAVARRCRGLVGWTQAHSAERHVMQKIAIIMENDNGDLFGYINSKDLNNKIDFETAFMPHVTSFPEAIEFCKGYDADIYFRIGDRWQWMKSTGRGTCSSCGHDFIGKVYRSLTPWAQPNDIEAHEVR